MQRLERKSKGNVTISLIVGVDFIPNLPASIGTKTANGKELVTVDEQIVNLHCNLLDRYANLRPHIILVKFHLTNFVEPISGFGNSCQRSVIEKVANNLQCQEAVFPLVALGITKSHPHNRHDIHQDRRFMTILHKLRNSFCVISFVALVGSQHHGHTPCIGVRLRDQTTWISLSNLSSYSADARD